MASVLIEGGLLSNSSFYRPVLNNEVMATQSDDMNKKKDLTKPRPETDKLMPKSGAIGLDSSINIESDQNVKKADDKVSADVKLSDSYDEEITSVDYKVDTKPGA